MKTIRTDSQPSRLWSRSLAPITSTFTGARICAILTLLLLALSGAPAMANTLLFQDTFNNTQVADYYWIAGDTLCGLNQELSSRQTGLYANTTYASSGGGQGSLGVNHPTHWELYGNGGVPGDLYMANGATVKVSPNHDFSGTDSAGGLDVSFDLGVHQGPGTYAVTVSFGSSSALGTPELNLVLNNDGSLSGTTSGTWLGSAVTAWHHIDLKFTDATDGNPFDGSGTPVVNGYVDSSPTPFLTYSVGTSFAHNYITVGSAAPGGNQQNGFDNFAVSNDYSAPSDTTPPVWTSGWPKADTITRTGFTARARTNENGKAYYLVLAGGASAPTPATVKTTGASIDLTADAEGTAAVTGLTPGTAYDVYFVAEDTVLNLQTADPPAKVSITTLPFVAGSLLFLDTFDNTHEGDYYWLGGDSLCGLNQELNSRQSGLYANTSYANSGGGQGFLGVNHPTHWELYGNPGVPGELYISNGSCKVSPNHDFSGTDSAGGLVVSFDAGMHQPDPGSYSVTVSFGSSSALGEPQLTLQFNNDGSLSGTTSGTWLGSAVAAFHHFDLKFTDATDGNPFNGSGTPVLNGYLDGSLTPFLTYSVGTSFANNYITLGSSGTAGNRGNAFDNFTIINDSSAPPSSPYASWVGPFFGGSTDPLIVGQAADPDGDNQNNLMEFALDGNPNNGALNAKVYSQTGVVTGEYSGQKVLILTIAVRDGTDPFAGTPSTAVNATDGIKYTVQGGNDLVGWTGSIFPCADGTVTPDDWATLSPGYHYQSFALTGTEGLPGKAFMQVKVEPNP